MPVIHIATWPIADDSCVRALVEDVTRAVHSATGAPLDKISVYLTEVAPSRWADAGVLGTDPEFGRTSRRLAYGEPQ